MTHVVEPKSRLAIAVLLVSLVLFAFSATASAQEPDDERRAAAYYEQGVDAFFNKKYSLALTYFKRAHTLDPDPVFLYNISRAHSKLGNPVDALEAATEAQGMDGLPPDTLEKNAQRIVAYQRGVTATEICEALSPSDVDLGDDEAPERGLSMVGWSGVGVASLGAAALIGAGAVNMMVSGDIDDYEAARADGDFERAQGLHGDIGDQQQIGQMLLYSGAGLIAVGGGLFAYDLLGFGESSSGAEQEKGAKIYGGASGDGVSVQMRWSF
jgi:tetratricopeptide (TPR) repeat protein